MKKISRKLAITLGLVLSLSLLSDLPQNTANANSPAQRGGGGGGGAGQHVGGGMHAGGVRSGGGGGIHAPAIGGPRNGGGNSGRGVRSIGGGAGHVVNRPPANHSPSLSHPNPGGFRPGINHGPAPGNHGVGNQGVGNHGIGNTLRGPGRLAGNGFGPRNNGINGQNNTRNGIKHPFASHPSGIASRQYRGNSLNFNNRQLNIGNNNYRPSYYRHSGYHGYWNGNRGYGIGSGFGYGPGSSIGYGHGPNLGYGWGLGNGYGNGYGSGYGYGGRYRRSGGYGYRPLGWGLGGWGLGSLIYNSGYLGYSNPYYSTGGWSGYNYSQPIMVSYNRPVTVVDNTVDSATSTLVNSADQIFNNAVAAFQQNDYNAALDITNKGITQFPDDAVLHEFRSLVLFAKQDYQQSAATIHSVLAVGPGWDWTTLIGLYSDASLYTAQLRALEAFTKSHPQDAAGQFLLAYHYLTCGHTDAGASHLQQAVTLMPSDRVAADMLKMVAKPTAEELTKAPAPDASEPVQSELPAIDPKSLVGAWQATRDDGSAFSLTLTDDAAFTWSFTPKGQAAQEFGGTYSIEDNVLALERKDGGSLIAEITSADASMFNFKMLGATDDDHGLNFSK